MKYGSEFYLLQSMHTFTTQTNEVLNISHAVVILKEKVLHETSSFHYRHAIVVAIHNWGHDKYWTSVFDAVGISYSKHFVTFLERTNRKKALQKTYHMKTDTKRRRVYK